MNEIWNNDNNNNDNNKNTRGEKYRTFCYYDKKIYEDRSKILQSCDNMSPSYCYLYGRLHNTIKLFIFIHQTQANIDLFCKNEEK